MTTRDLTVLSDGRRVSFTFDGNSNYLILGMATDLIRATCATPDKGPLYLEPRMVAIAIQNPSGHDSKTFVRYSFRKQGSTLLPNPNITCLLVPLSFKNRVLQSYVTMLSDLSDSALNRVHDIGSVVHCVKEALTSYHRWDNECSEIQRGILGIAHYGESIRLQAQQEYDKADEILTRMHLRWKK